MLLVWMEEILKLWLPSSLEDEEGERGDGDDGDKKPIYPTQLH
jgi:hypothetical protein